jgi:hypothetical protein
LCSLREEGKEAEQTFLFTGAECVPCEVQAEAECVPCEVQAKTEQIVDNRERNSR